MKGVLPLLFAILAGSVVSVQATCQQDFEHCKKVYQDALPATTGHADALCMVTNNFISCLRNLTADPQQHADCSSILSTINDARRKAEQQLNRDVPGCLLCTREVDTCEAAFKNSTSRDSHNITAVCIDTQAVVDCLLGVAGKAECAAEQTHVQEIRRKAEETLNQCNTRKVCQSGIHACEVQQAAAKKTATTHDQECKVTDDFYHCLLRQQCTGESAKDLKIAIDSIVAEAKAGHCPFTIDGADAHCPRPLLTLAVALLVLALTAKLN